MRSGGQQQQCIRAVRECLRQAGSLTDALTATPLSYILGFVYQNDVPSSIFEGRAEPLVVF